MYGYINGWTIDVMSSMDVFGQFKTHHAQQAGKDGFFPRWAFVSGDGIRGGAEGGWGGEAEVEC
jgi:hypothetical protein